MRLFDWARRRLGGRVREPNMHGQAALTNDQEAIGEPTNDLAQACDHCHRV